ncbi:relaxase domain-containing protein, partial [Chromobacterium amazonense]|uniref:relaxase domain-containing protein n=1 Tax=Chromobacterium amazonense TaxID=1382803 RepID=UPI003F7B19F7
TRVPQMTAPDGTKRMAYDFTFSAPKSFSMQSLMDKDPQVREALMQAHLAAVRKAMEPLEALAKTRKRENGMRHVERTGNIVAGLFQHDLSRALMPD